MRRPVRIPGYRRAWLWVLLALAVAGAVLIAVVLIRAASAVQRAPVTQQVDSVALPDARLTPGEGFAGVTAAQVCSSGWARAHRNVVLDQYHQVYAAYGIPYPQPRGTYELDHLIPLELGGDNSDANLWPEPASPAPGFHQKDDLENALHDMVCSGAMRLGDAQHAIASNWYAAYQMYVVK